jgi:uncharacterized protein YdhG (YjbR/CyaY superfamily)
MRGKKATDVDEYIKLFTSDIQRKLRQIRGIIEKAAPASEEKISHKMPMVHSSGVLVYFAAFKNHIGFFPTASGIHEFKSELREYKIAKGTIQLPYDKPIPVELIRRIVAFRVEENRKRMKSESLPSGTKPLGCLPERHCKQCGILFTPHSRKQEYCSTKCRSVHSIRRR